MIQELWHSFPRLLEQHIHSLLDRAEPNSMKAFHLYKSCQRENLWNESFEKFSSRLGDFFAKPRAERRKSDLDLLMNRPVSSDVFADFHLDFRSAVVDSRALLNIASWAHHLMRVSLKTDCAVISGDVLTRTLQRLTQPGVSEKADGLEFDDFCLAWKKIVFGLFGRKYDTEFQRILRELDHLQATLREEEKEKAEGRAFLPTIYLTQTEIDWTMAVHRAVVANEEAPKFPLSRGPQKQRLAELKRTIDLYHIVRTSKTPEFIQHRETIRATLIDRCEGLLRDKAS